MNNIIKVTVYTFIFILLSLIFGYLTFTVLSFSRTVEVPDLYGKGIVEASKLLSSKGLYLIIEGDDYSSHIPVGHILSQNVPAGSKVKERRAIKVIISKGPRIELMPTLVNETLFDAESMLLQKGLKIAKVIRVHSDTVEKDRILAQKPEPGEKVSDHIVVVVSLGPHDVIYYCPDFKGMSAEQTTKLVEKLGMKIKTEGYGSYVVAQKPFAGAHVKKGDTIYLQLE